MTTPSGARTALTIAAVELHDGLRSRWLWLYAGVFAVLAGLLANLALPGAATAGYGAFGRSAASLIALVQLIVPLLGLTLGAQALTARREPGSLRFLMGHPVTRSEAFAGTFLGLLGAMLLTVTAGFGAAGTITALSGGGVDALAFIRIAALAWLLAGATLAIGMVVGAWTRRPGLATGIAGFAWFCLVFAGDIGLMGSAVSARMPASMLVASAMANPVEAFRLATLSTFQDSLDVLGPAGSYAVDRFGGALDFVLVASMVIWLLIALAIGWFRFARRADL